MQNRLPALMALGAPISAARSRSLCPSATGTDTAPPGQQLAAGLLTNFAPTRWGDSLDNGETVTPLLKIAAPDLEGLEQYQVGKAADPFALEVSQCSRPRARAFGFRFRAVR